MRRAADVIAGLRTSGQLWEPAPGLVALRGPALGLYQRLERELSQLAHAEADEEWLVPPAIAFHTLARADYFASFPQWLTAAAHLDAADGELAGIAAADDVAGAAVAALRPRPIALQPAVCYHVYEALAGTTLDAARVCTLQGTCWRHEAAGFTPLERGWAFTMREVVCLGSAISVAAFRTRMIEATSHFAERLGLRPVILQASDPFFAPSTRGRALLQRVRALKHELHLPLGDGRAVAAASFNDHAHFFGTAFDIRMTDGSPATTGCVAFGVERWLLALLVEYGTRPLDWPLSPQTELLERSGLWSL